jgi:hypothetical protein
MIAAILVLGHTLRPGGAGAEPGLRGGLHRGRLLDPSSDQGSVATARPAYRPSMGARHDPRSTAALIVLVALALGGGLWRWSATAAVPTLARTPFPAAAPAPAFRVPAEWLAAADGALPATERVVGRRGPVALATELSVDIPVASGPHDLEFVCVGDVGREGVFHVMVPGATTDLVGFGCAVEPQLIRFPFYAVRAGVVTIQTRAGVLGAVGAWQVVRVRPVRSDWPEAARHALGGAAALAGFEVALPTLNGPAPIRLGRLRVGVYRAEVVCVGDGAATITAGSRIPPRTRTIVCDARPITYPVTVRSGSADLGVVLERSWGTGFLVWRLFADS